MPLPLWIITSFGAFTSLLPPQPNPPPLFVTSHILLSPSPLLLKGGYIEFVT